MFSAVALTEVTTKDRCAAPHEPLLSVLNVNGVVIGGVKNVLQPFLFAQQNLSSCCKIAVNHYLCLSPYFCFSADNGAVLIIFFCKCNIS